MKPRARAGSIIAVVSVLSAFAACGEILNVDGIEIVPPGAGIGGAGGTGGSPSRSCTPGEFRCTGAALQLCDEVEDAFRTVRVCSSAELCCDDPAACEDQPGCRAPTCSAGDFRCQGELLEQCNDARTGFVALDRCASELHCNASLGRCTEQPCDATLREQQCSGGNLEECLPGRSAWSPINACGTQTLCRSSTSESCALAACRISNPGSPPSPYICMSGNLLRCKDDQTRWEHVETCLNPANCNALIESLVGDPYAPLIPTEELERLGCTAPGCAPGRYRCDGANLMLCGANRTGYLDRVGTCMSPRHCKASAGVCSPDPCTVGEHQCSGDEFQVCTATGWQLVEQCSSGAPCDPRSGCQATACRSNEYRCNGVELERCNVERTDWIPVSTCDTTALCNVAAKRCEAPACEADGRRCTSDGVLERCNSGRSGWDPIRNCAALAAVAPGSSASSVCDPSGEGQCLPSAACTAEALRCNGAELEICRENAWHPYEHCATAAQCDVAGGTCLDAICEPGSFRCVTPEQPRQPPAEGTSRRGLALERCNTRGTGFEPARSCAAIELCDDAHGQCDICDPTVPPLCAGNELLVCTADGQEQTLYKACTEGCIAAGTNGSDRTTCREDLQAAASN